MAKILMDFKNMTEPAKQIYFKGYQNGLYDRNNNLSFGLIGFIIGFTIATISFFLLY